MRIAGSNHFAFKDAHPATLAAMRIVIAAQALWILLSRDPVGVVQLPPVIWDGVDRAHRVRFLLAPGIPGIETAVWTCAVVSLACVLVGYRTRVFGVIAALALYHLAPLISLVAVAGPWGKGLTIPTLTLPILGCSPCEDRWSMMALRRRVPERDPGAYGWAVTLVRLLFSQIYLFSGLAKLRTAGLAWASARTARNHLLLFALLVPDSSTPLNAWVAAHPALCTALGAGTLALELFFVVAVFVRSVRVPLVIAAALFHVGLWVTLGFRFLNLPHLLLFVDLGSSKSHGGTPRLGIDGRRSEQVDRTVP